MREKQRLVTLVSLAKLLFAVKRSHTIEWCPLSTETTTSDEFIAHLSLENVDLNKEILVSHVSFVLTTPQCTSGAALPTQVPSVRLGPGWTDPSSLTFLQVQAESL